MDLGELKARLTADDTDYVAKMKAAERQAASTAKTVSNSLSKVRLNIPKLDLSGVTSTFKDVFGGVVSGNLVSGALQSVINGLGGAMKTAWTSGIEYNKMLETGAVRMERFFKSAADAKAFTAQIEKFAIDSPIFELPQALTGAQRLLQMKFAARDIPQ